MTCPRCNGSGFVYQGATGRCPQCNPSRREALTRELCAAITRADYTTNKSDFFMEWNVIVELADELENTP